MEDWIILAKSIMPDCIIMNEGGMNTLSWRGEYILFHDPLNRENELIVMWIINSFRDSILGCLQTTKKELQEYISVLVQELQKKKDLLSDNIEL